MCECVWNIIRASISLAAGNQKQRRDLLLHELSSWNNIIAGLYVCMFLYVCISVCIYL